MRRWYTRVVSLLLCLAIAATLIPNVPFTVASTNPDANGVYHIYNFADFMGAVGYSRTPGGNTLTYVLENDIEFTPENVAAMKGWDIDHLTFGSRDYFFLGEFDGGGHTISGLNYENNLFKVATRTGLFSFVGHKDPAEALKYNTYIHDLTIKGASMHADYCSGILVGEAYNTRFENIRIVDSSISVNPADNAVVLITDGGVYGGALAGYAESCTFYNCESKDTTVRTNSVGAVAALSGKPLYLGGLVGDLENSELEYCRVIGGEVKNRYESSVGALGGFTCYAGGLVGQAGGMRHQVGSVGEGEIEKFEPGDPSKLIDCFATCNVSFYAATYVGVGAGCSGHAGGLVGKVDDSGKKDAAGKETGAMIKRCHYAGGTISSYQYNTLLLMIPVQIAHDVNRSGLADIYEPKTIQVYDSYFNYADGIGPKNGKPANVLGDKNISANYGPQPDERYMDRSFWENRGYDFAGNLDRSDEDGTKGPLREETAYYNKWVMYYYDDPVLDADGNQVYENGILKTVRRGYPVHGLSVAATLDFPGAGEVTLTPTMGKDSLSHAPVSTRDPYRFAVLGFYPTERTVTTYTDGTPTKGGVGLSFAPTNEGYRWVGWYLVEDVAAAGLPTGQHEYFEKIFAADPTKLTALHEDNEHIPVENNQLYIARCEAQVVFHGLDGKTLSKATGAAEETPDLTDDWYFYAIPLPKVPMPSLDSGATLIGWVDRTGSAEKGCEAITSAELADLKRQGIFYEAGDPILKTLDLYPVYADRTSYIRYRIEGHDTGNLQTRTDTVEVWTQDNGNISAATPPTQDVYVGHVYLERASDGGAPTLHATPHSTNDLKGEANFPEGYRFLGWYEIELNADGTEGTAHLVSRSEDFTLTDVDLDRNHLYEARFEYRVQAWLPVKVGNLNMLVQYSDQFRELYVPYGTTLFTGIETVDKKGAVWHSDYIDSFDYNWDTLLDDNRWKFEKWSDNVPRLNEDGTYIQYDKPIVSDTGSHVHMRQTSRPYDITSKVQAPVVLCGVFRSAGYNTYATDVKTDFPNSGTAAIEENGKDDGRTVSVTVKDGYHYIFFDAVKKTSDQGTDTINGSSVSVSSGTTEHSPGKMTWQSALAVDKDWAYLYTAHMVAEVNFHQAVEETRLVDTSALDPQPAEPAVPVTLTAADYPYLTADKTVSMTRRYRSPVFGAPNNVYDSYSGSVPAQLTFDGTAPYSPAAERGAAPSREVMTIPGYYFVGWFEKAAWEQSDLNYFLDVTPAAGEPRYQSSSIARCKPYVLSGDAVVEHAMELYPVYVKYHIDTATSVNLAVEGVVQKPDDPTWEPEYPTADKTTLTLTAYNNVPVRETEPDGDKYTIEYVTVSIDGGEPVVIADHTTDGSGNWQLTYEVVPGKHYLFTAVYKPYVVVFHRNGNTEAEVEVRDYGRPIGVSYLPTVQDTEEELNYALFVGWTETAPEDPAARPYHFFSADPEGTENGKTSYQKARDFGFWTLAQTEDTLVTHSMELWPVYADYTVSVNSNIDQELMTTKPTIYPDETALREKVRSLERESANTVSTTVKAIEVDGYKFDGWYTGVERDETGAYTIFDNATAISEAGSYTLEGSEPFTSKLYTARYRKVYKVIYHKRGKDGGGVLYVNYLYEGQDEGKALNQKITATVDAPKKDEAGNIIRDEAGNVIMVPTETTYHQPLDPTPYHMIYGTMAHNESFGQWECHEPGTPETGNDLVNVYPMSFEPLLPYVDENGVEQPGLIGRVGPNKREINLYPTVWTVDVTDEAGNPINDQVDIDIDMSDMTDDYQKVKANVCFNQAKPYTGSKLTVQVKRTRWVETGDPNKPKIENRGRNKVFVTPYTDTSKTDQLADGKMTANLKGTTNDQDDGFAEFTFGSGLLRLTKNAPTDRKDETFLFQVTDTADAAKTWRVAVKCGADVTTAQEDGSMKVTGCTGETFLRLPPGEYSVTELTDWAWRQEPMYAVYVGGVLQEAADAHQTVRVASMPIGETAVTETAKVVCTNSALGGKDWLVRTTRWENLFNPPS